MSITNELREFAPHLDIGKVALAGWKEGLLVIADHIDAEHEKAIRELNNLADSCVLLPKDANGEYIHIGDVMEWECPPHDPFDVIGIGRNGTLFYCTDECASFALWTAAGNKRHHHEPTVEDVLREFAGTLASAENNWGSDVNDAIAKYAAKLQLRGDGE